MTLGVALRVALVLAYFGLKASKPFRRLIHREELWLYSNPMTVSYISIEVVAAALTVLPFVLAYLAHGVILRPANSQTEQHCWKRDLVSLAAAYTLLMALTLMVVELLKVTVGRPRPDFAFRCWPSTEGLPPDDSVFRFPKGLGYAGHHHLEALSPDGQWAQDLKCDPGVAPSVVMEGLKSFPSGHSALSFAGFGFAVFYLLGKLVEQSRVVRPMRPSCVAAFIAIMMSKQQ